MTTEYTIRSSARRAARATGVNPDLVWRNASGKWQLPVCAAAQTAEQPGVTQPERPAQEGSDPEAHPLDIPAALRVENRKPLTPEQREKLARTMAGVGISLGEKPDPSKPKGLSAAEWRAHKEEVASAKHAKALERVAKLRESPAGQRRAAKAARLPRPRREDAFRPTDVVRVLLDRNPCRPGTAAHAIFEKYRTGMTVAEFEKAAAKTCPGRLRPVDYLIYDSKKGRISVGSR